MVAFFFGPRLRVLAYPEARATIARRRRERLMTAAEVEMVVAQLDADWPRFVVMSFGDDLAREAGALTAGHALRGGDAVHLATFARLVVRCDDGDVRFSGADARLTKAARRLG